MANRSKKAPISRAYNPDATTLTVPMLKKDREKLEQAAAEEAKKLGLTKLPTSEWARRLLFKAARIKI